MLPSSDLAYRKTCIYSQFRLGKVGLDSFQKQVITQGFDIDGNQLAGAKSLFVMVKIDQHRSVCNNQHLTQRPLPLEFWIER